MAHFSFRLTTGRQGCLKAMFSSGEWFAITHLANTWFSEVLVSLLSLRFDGLHDWLASFSASLTFYHCSGSLRLDVFLSCYLHPGPGPCETPVHFQGTTATYPFSQMISVPGGIITKQGACFSAVTLDANPCRVQSSAQEAGPGKGTQPGATAAGGVPRRRETKAIQAVALTEVERQRDQLATDHMALQRRELGRLADGPITAAGDDDDDDVPHPMKDKRLVSRTGCIHHLHDEASVNPSERCSFVSNSSSWPSGLDHSWSRPHLQLLVTVSIKEKADKGMG